MGNVYLGRIASESGFQRLYAIKVLHPHLAHEEAFVEMLLDEAHIAARLHHPNVVWRASIWVRKTAFITSSWSTSRAVRSRFC